VCLLPAARARASQLVPLWRAVRCYAGGHWDLSPRGMIRCLRQVVPSIISDVLPRTAFPPHPTESHAALAARNML
jgi:hypothetical protein